MNKKNIIIISCAVIAVAVIIAIILVLALSSKKGNVKIEVYDANFQLSKTIELKKSKQIKELEEICNNVSTEQDDLTPYLGIRNDIKLIFENGTYFILQKDLKEYCYYVNSKENIESAIKMPEGLYDVIKNIIDQN